MLNVDSIPKNYDPRNCERKWYHEWLEKQLFQADADSKKPPFVIVIPPPNVTGVLHMGHVLNNTIQDIIIRYKRMDGFETLWLPGTDHAGIATQNVVEKSLAKEGKTRYDLGREKFVDKVWEWEEKHGNHIIEQLKYIGASCDWSRQRFTMDEGLSDAVKEVFVSLYEKGLIYKGNYIINWCPRCETALANDEVEHEDLGSHLWHIRYPLVENPKEYLVVATTRPETMLGDVAVAVNPKDERYQRLIGQKVQLPLTDRQIPIIADEYVDLEFGTGVVKITPAHDPNDFEVGQRHQLETLSVMNENAQMNENAGVDYCGMDRFECRQKLLDDLKEQKLLHKIEPHTHAVGHCYRCHTVIEPYLSEQWFVKMEPLARRAIEVVRNGKVKIVPERWEKVYFNWLENVRDWCISRQIWWGHRIPAYYCEDCGELMVAKETPQQCAKCGSSKIRQDDDVLDTWFSSWLWPFSTMGWPEKTKDLATFFPSNTLVTASGIIFLWVARMIMSSLEFMDEIPFDRVFFHGMVLDEQSRKMSKSLGNSPDPIDVIDEYGADALRFSMVFSTPRGADVVYSNDLLETGRNFSNKVWNASRFIFQNTAKMPTVDPSKVKLGLAEKWILSRLQKAIAEVRDGLDTMKLNDATHKLYDFFWNEFCAWYLEISKVSFYQSDDETAQHTAKYVLLTVLDKALRLLHPFMPFISEEIWQNVKALHADLHEDYITVASFPAVEEDQMNTQIETDFAFLQEMIIQLRSVRKEMNIPPAKKAQLCIRATAEKVDLINRYAHLFFQLGGISEVEASVDMEKPAASVSIVLEDCELHIPLKDLLDLDKEKQRLEKEIENMRQEVERIEKKLSNEKFVSKAPEQVVQAERGKLETYREKQLKLEQSLKNLQV